MDVTAPIKADIGSVRMDWNTAAEWTVVNNGHAIQANTLNRRKITISDTDYQLRQCHFHTPSEHAVDGKRMAMEVHFVHVLEDGTLAVLGAMMGPGGPNDMFHNIMDKAPKSTGEVDLAFTDNANLLTQDDGVFRYQGSLTTPPCAEVVVWTEIKSPIALHAEDISTFAAIFPKNARPFNPPDDALF